MMLFFLTKLRAQCLAVEQVSYMQHITFCEIMQKNARRGPLTFFSIVLLSLSSFNSQIAS